MDYTELQARVATWMHRSDLQGEIPKFIDHARQRINRRFGTEYPQLVSGSDTNESLAEHGDMWVFAAVTEGFLFVQNGGAADVFNQRYLGSADQVNITATAGEDRPQVRVYNGS